MAGDGRGCATCSLRVALTTSFAGNSSARSADATLSGVASPDEGDTCNVTGGFLFSWQTNATDGAGAPLAVAAARSPALFLAARTLGAGQTAHFTLYACFAGAITTCSSGAVSFFVAPSPLVALISGGDGVVGETPVPLSASSSYDPDGAPFSELAFAWSCMRLDGAEPACAARDGTPQTFGSAATQRVQLAGAAGGALYAITLTVSRGARQSTARTTLTVLPGALPLVSIAGSAVLAGAKADPSQQLVMLASASSTTPGGVTTRWSLAAQGGAASSLPKLNLSDPAVCATPVTSSSMVLRSGALAPGGRYVFQLSATDSVGAVGLANATVAASAPPRGGWAEVAPAIGVGLATDFELRAVGWTADPDEMPLTYSCSYFMEGTNDPPISLTGGLFQVSPLVRCSLPALR